MEKQEIISYDDDKDIKELKRIVNKLSAKDNLAVRAISLMSNEMENISSKVEDVTRDIKVVNDDHKDLKREFYDFREDELERRELTTTQVNDIHDLKNAKVLEILGIAEEDNDPDFLIFNPILSRMIWSVARREANLGRPISRTSNKDYKNVCKCIANFEIPYMWKGAILNSLTDLKEWALRYDGQVRNALKCQLKKPVFREILRDRRYDKFVK